MWNYKIFDIQYESYEIIYVHNSFSYYHTHK